MNFVAQAPLRPNTEAVTDQEHPDHQLRVDRGASCVAVETSEVAAKLAEIEEPIDASQQMIGRYVCFKVERVEELVLRASLLPHHLCALRFFLLIHGTQTTADCSGVFQHNRSKAVVGEHQLS